MLVNNCLVSLESVPRLPDGGGQFSQYRITLWGLSCWHSKSSATSLSTHVPEGQAETAPSPLISRVHLMGEIPSLHIGRLREVVSAPLLLRQQVTEGNPSSVTYGHQRWDYQMMSPSHPSCIIKQKEYFTVVYPVVVIKKLSVIVTHLIMKWSTIRGHQCTFLSIIYLWAWGKKDSLKLCIFGWGCE